MQEAPSLKGACIQGRDCCRGLKARCLLMGKSRHYCIHVRSLFPQRSLHPRKRLLQRIEGKMFVDGEVWELVSKEEIVQRKEGK
eukprot:4504172-Ditylum_brightwellii.AAC.1